MKRNYKEYIILLDALYWFSISKVKVSNWLDLHLVHSSKILNLDCQVHI